jgi:hypothetical protein
VVTSAGLRRLGGAIADGRNGVGEADEVGQVDFDQPGAYPVGAGRRPSWIQRRMVRSDTSA